MRIFANDMTDKGLIYKIYKQLIQLNIKANKQQPNWKIGRRPEQTFSQREHADAQQAQKRSSTLLTIREVQIKFTVRYHLTPVRMAIIKKNTNNKCWWGCGEKGTLIHCWCSHCGKQYRGFSKNWKKNYCMIQQFHSWVYIWKKQKHDTCTPMFIAALFTIAKIWK